MRETPQKEERRDASLEFSGSADRHQLDGVNFSRNHLSSSHPSPSTIQVARTNGAVRAGKPSVGKNSVTGTEIRIPKSGGIRDRLHRKSATAASVAL